MSHARDLSDWSTIPYRPVQFFSSDVELRHSGGALLMHSKESLGAYSRRMGDWLDRWLARVPSRSSSSSRRRPASARSPTGGARTRVEARRGIAAIRLERGASARHHCAAGHRSRHSDDCRVVCRHSLGSGCARVCLAKPRLPRSSNAVAALLTPGMVAVADGAEYREALAAAAMPELPAVAFANPVGSQLDLAALQNGSAHPERVAAAAGKVGPDTIANSCSRPDRPAIPRPSSTRTACCAPPARCSAR